MRIAVLALLAALAAGAASYPLHSQTPVATPQTELAARGESPAAFGWRCIPAGCVAPRSNTPGILARRALPSGRIATLGATLDFHHGLLTALAAAMLVAAPTGAQAPNQQLEAVRNLLRDAPAPPDEEAAKRIAALQ